MDIEDKIDSCLQDIFKEVLSARKKFPNTEGLMAALTEEVGELATACMEEPIENVYNEAKQVAAVAIRIMIEGDPSLNKVRLRGNVELF